MTPAALLLAVSAAAAQTPLDVKALGGPPSDLAVNEAGAVVLSAPGGLYDLGGRRFLPRPSTAPVAALALAGNTLYYAAGGALHSITKGKAELLLGLSLDRVTLAAAGPRLYIAGSSAGGRAALFVYEKGRGWRRLIDLPEAPDALAAAGERVYFSIGPAIFTFRPGEALRMEAALTGFKRFESLAADADGRALFVSDKKSVAALLLETGRLVLLSPKAGGVLRFAGRTLALLAENPPGIRRFDNLPEALASGRIETVALRKRP